MTALHDWARETLGHPFTQPALLTEALTHRSYANEVGRGVRPNQRMEYLGDSVVGLVMGHYLYQRFPDLQEGELSRLRAAVVSEPTLARRARALGFGPRLRLGKGEAHSGGRERDSNLADAFEAVVAALYLDSGLPAAETFVLRELVPEIEAALTHQTHHDFKSLLQEKLQQLSPVSPTYRLIEEAGPDHAKTFTMAVDWQGDELGRGTGRSKKEAEQAAARMALLSRGS